MAANPDPKVASAPPPPVGAEAKAQAGGGAAVIYNKRAQRVEKFNRTLTNYLTTAYHETNKIHGYSGTRQGIVEFLHHEQGISREAAEQELPKDMKALDVNGFIDILSGAEANDVFEKTLKEEETLYPLSNYFISSSHNTYLTGNQLYSDSSADAYKNVLLRGCRCVEIDVWDGEEPSDGEEQEGRKESKRFRKKISKFGHKLKKHVSSSDESGTKSPEPPRSDSNNDEEGSNLTPTSSRAEPRVLHGYTATKEIPFRAVCEAIRDYAFITSEHPVIVSLEVHTGLEQQQIMVDIMQEYWKGMLVDLPTIANGVEVPLPMLKDLHKKILIKVKYSPKPPPNKIEPTQLAPEKAPEKATRASTASSASSTSSVSREAASDQPEKKAKMLDALSELGVYTRSYHFSGFDQPEAKIPTHVFSLSEKSLMEVHKTTPSDLFTHNKDFLMRAYPKGLRVSSSNLDPSVFWRKGVQIVALNWQKWDAGTMMNEAMFAGTGGWVLKPGGYRSSSISQTQSHASDYSKLDLSVEFFAGQDITLPPEEDDPDKFKPFVKCELHVETNEERTAKDIAKEGRSKGGLYKKHTRTARGINPDFKRETISFKDVPNVAPDLAFLR
jgi:hypothetical protein